MVLYGFHKIPHTHFQQGVADVLELKSGDGGDGSQAGAQTYMYTTKKKMNEMFLRVTFPSYTQFLCGVIKKNKNILQF